MSRGQAIILALVVSIVPWMGKTILHAEEGKPPAPVTPAATVSSTPSATEGAQTSAPGPGASPNSTAPSAAVQSAAAPGSVGSGVTAPMGMDIAPAPAE